MFKRPGVKMRVIVFLLGLLVTMVAAWSAFIQVSLSDHGEDIVDQGKDIVQLQTEVKGWEIVRQSVERSTTRINASADLIMQSNDRLMQHMNDCSLRQINHEIECQDWRDEHRKKHKDPGD